MAWVTEPLELLIRGGIEDNSKICYVVTPHENRLGGMVLMRGHIMCLTGVP